MRAITGNEGGVRYTVLVTGDAGGGTVIIPGSNGSASAPQDFASTVFVGRARKDIGHSFIGALADGSARPGRRRAQWRRSGPTSSGARRKRDVVTGQWLFSETRTPNRPEQADEWNGQAFTGGALQT